MGFMNTTRYLKLLGYLQIERITSIKNQQR